MKYCEDCGKPIDWILYSTCVECAIKKPRSKSFSITDFFKLLLHKEHRQRLKISWMTEASPRFYCGLVAGPRQNSYIFWIDSLHLEIPIGEPEYGL